MRCLSEAVLDPSGSRVATLLRGRSVRRSRLDRWASRRLGERDHETVRKRGESNRHWPAASSNVTSGYGYEPRPADETRSPVRTASGIDPEYEPQWRPTGERLSLATLVRSLPQNLQRNMRGRQGLPTTRRKTGSLKETLPMTTTVPLGISERLSFSKYLLGGAIRGLALGPDRQRRSTSRRTLRPSSFPSRRSLGTQGLGRC